jgi:phosphate:Na+ symporter
MGLMSEGMKPLRAYEPFMEMLARMENPLLGILAGAVFTGLVQSSAATVGIAIAMASEGLLTLPAGIALALGANIGTCVTALLAALGKPTEAVRAATVHVSFNILGVVVWLPFLGLLSDIAIAVSPVAEGLEGKAQLAFEVPRQIANANTMFNVINTLLFIGFTTWFARLAERLVPDRTSPPNAIIKPEFLDDKALEVPAVAIANARYEIHRAGKITLEMMDDIHQALGKRDNDALGKVARRNDAVAILEAEIMLYLGHVRQRILTDGESREHQSLMTVIVDLESLADIMDSEMTPLAKAYLEGAYEVPSEETRELVHGLWDSVRRALELSVQALGENDQRLAQEVLHMKDSIRDLSDRFFARHAGRLRPDDPKYLERVRMLMTFIGQLRHIYTLTKRIAKAQLEATTVKQAI